MDQKILEFIEEHREEMVSTLMSLIECPSPDTGDTPAQEIVDRELTSMGFETESFMGSEDLVSALPDYCPPGVTYGDAAYNVAGRLRGKGTSPSLMLFAHIDTEAADCWGSFEEPFLAERRDGRIYGLGAADDKGGVAMMLEAVRTFLHFTEEPEYDLTVMSILGKHGGAFGTLSALAKGYTGENSIYLHPAETGHGFAEIKNISLGVLDLDLSVTGEPGIMHDDLSEGISANLILAQAVLWLEEYDRLMREKNRFGFGSFAGQPSYSLNPGSLRSDYGYGSIALHAECSLRCRFFSPMTPDSVFADISSYLSEKMKSAGWTDRWTLRQSSFRAAPVMVENDHPFVKLIEKNITEITGKTDFIHQYHGGSDIRLPMLYGNSRCVGIGPSCTLPEKGSGMKEWIDEEDYINGIKILTGILLTYPESFRN